MTTTGTTATVRDAPVARVFLAILQRDLYVTFRELPTFIAQVLLQPFFFVFVFGKVLADLGQTRPGYAQLLLPGIVALTSVLTGLQGTAFPLVIDFSFTKEIEDRLLAPLPLELVAVEKIVFGMIRALIAASVMFPIGLLVIGHIPFDVNRLPLLILALLLGAITGAAMGLTIGTFVSVQKINIVFALVLTPLLFTGCSQYPWPSLGREPRVVQDRDAVQSPDLCQRTVPGLDRAGGAAHRCADPHSGCWCSPPRSSSPQALSGSAGGRSPDRCQIRRPGVGTRGGRLGHRGSRQRRPFRWAARTDLTRMASINSGDEQQGQEP